MFMRSFSRPLLAAGFAGLVGVAALLTNPQASDAGRSPEPSFGPPELPAGVIEGANPFSDPELYGPAEVGSAEEARSTVLFEVRLPSGDFAPVSVWVEQPGSLPGVKTDSICVSDASGTACFGPTEMTSTQVVATGGTPSLWLATIAGPSGTGKAEVVLASGEVLSLAMHDYPGRNASFSVGAVALAADDTIIEVRSVS
jgi:hypothetical protein